MGNTLTFGSPSSGWPSFCSSCGKRTDVCDRRLPDATCKGAVRRSLDLPDRMQKGRSMKLDPKPRRI